MALLPSSVIEIRTLEPKQFIQRIELSSMLNSKLKIIVKCLNKKGHIYVSSNNDLYCLVAVPVQQQITQLLKERQFELALQLADFPDPESEDQEEAENKKENIIHHIKNLHAFHLFCKMKFKEAFEMFLDLDTDPAIVIGLFPDLLPEKYRSSITYPSSPPNFIGSDAEKSYFALTDYLISIRRKLISDSGSQLSLSSFTASSPSKTTTKTKNLLRQIVDTTLVKAYLKTNDALISSLLRLPDNYCHLEETEIALKKAHKFNELIILYQSKGLHKKALDLLYKQSTKANSVLSNHERTIQYLQNLGHQHLDLIFEYGSWVLKSYPEDGLKIFTDDIIPETEQLPRNIVLSYLEKINPNLVIPYLENIIWNWNDTTPDFHNSLVHKYREKVRNLLTEYVDSLPEAESPVSAGDEPGELGILRKKLLHFLENSNHYSTEILPTYLLNDGLFEERAVVMGKIGNHEEALTILVHLLGDTKKAEEYCERKYNKSIPGNRDVIITSIF